MYTCQESIDESDLSFILLIIRYIALKFKDFKKSQLSLLTFQNQLHTNLGLILPLIPPRQLKSYVDRYPCYRYVREERAIKEVSQLRYLVNYLLFEIPHKLTGALQNKLSKMSVQRADSSGKKTNMNNGSNHLSSKKRPLQSTQSSAQQRAEHGVENKSKKSKGSNMSSTEQRDPRSSAAGPTLPLSHISNSLSGSTQKKDSIEKNTPLVQPTNTQAQAVKSAEFIRDGDNTSRITGPPASTSGEAVARASAGGGTSGSGGVGKFENKVIARHGHGEGTRPGATAPSRSTLQLPPQILRKPGGSHHSNTHATGPSPTNAPAAVATDKTDDLLTRLLSAANPPSTAPATRPPLSPALAPARSKTLTRREEWAALESDVAPKVRPRGAVKSAPASTEFTGNSPAVTSTSGIGDNLVGSGLVKAVAAMKAPRAPTPPLPAPDDDDEVSASASRILC